MKPLYLLLTCLALLLPVGIEAENVGLSYLGICNPSWPCRRSLAAFDGVGVIRTGWLEQSFGERCACADRLLQDPRPKEVRIHLVNGPCLRNRRCGRQEVLHGFTLASAQRDLKRPNSRILGRYVPILERVRDRLAQSRGPLTCYVSPVLESDFGEQQRLLLHRLAGAYLPACTLVDSPHRRPCLPGKVCEGHGERPSLKRPCIADLDGNSAQGVNVPAYLRTYRGCDLALLWTPGMNCNRVGSSFSGDPAQRRCGTTAGEIDQLVKYLRTEFR